MKLETDQFLRNNGDPLRKVSYERTQRFFLWASQSTVAIQDAQGKSHGAIGSQKDIYIYIYEPQIQQLLGLCHQLCQVKIT